MLWPRHAPVQVVKLKAFSKFDNTAEALAAATALVESKLSKGALCVCGGSLPLPPPPPSPQGHPLPLVKSHPRLLLLLLLLLCRWTQV